MTLARLENVRLNLKQPLTIKPTKTYSENPLQVGQKTIQQLSLITVIKMMHWITQQTH